MKISLVSIPVQDPVKAHEIYTSILGFKSVEFNPEAQLAVVSSPEEPDGTAIILEPCIGTFAEQYQKSAMDAKLPIIVFGVTDTTAELNRLKEAGISVRPDLDNPEWGLKNMFEDGCGNLIMLQGQNA
jgi:catechol 2,3-dioxygenase-like lactoylglutathione lyase family enzyme